MPTADDFRQKIEEIMELARQEGKEWIEICSRDLHERVGGYPSRDHRMATCCGVMYAKKKSSDIILSAPPKGKGASLRIKYFL